jgi:hypothetical protein
MTTRIDVEYDRQNTNADIQEIVARATVTVSVLHQLGTAYQSLPGIAMAAYQAEIDAIEADMTALSTLINQILPLLVSLDAKAAHRSPTKKQKGPENSRGTPANLRRKDAARPNHRPNPPKRRQHTDAPFANPVIPLKRHPATLLPSQCRPGLPSLLMRCTRPA